MADGDDTDPAFDADHVAVASGFRRASFPRRLATFAALDEAFAHAWLDHVARTLARPGLDRRTRLLTLVAQYTVTEAPEALEETVEAAIDAGVDPREALEVILQSYVYAGENRVGAAAEVFLDVVRRRGLLEDVQRRQLRKGDTRTDRDLDAERGTWAPGDRDHPRLPEFLHRYGWHGLSTGMRLRPGHPLGVAGTLDALDGDFLSIWLDTVQEAIYSRGVLDERTRLLCVIANCLAMGATHQAPRHMRVALRSGATPRELFEVIAQSCAVVGHPGIMPLAFDDLVTLLDEVGRLREMVDDDRIDEVRRITAARIAARHGTTDLQAGGGAAR